MPDINQNHKGRPNRLIHEKSPYLLQHAYNPVDWYPWCEEAFKTAAKQDKPIFLSIGYSTCHWCHVMEQESFEDPEVAQALNEAFVCIKVDREERPDIDSVYMTAAQLLNSQGGWPLTIIMTPEKKPFYAATYLPKHTHLGRLGITNLIPMIKKHWDTNRGKVMELSSQVISALEINARPKPGEELDQGILNDAYLNLSRNFDENHGGFGTAPKFPTPHNLSFLLRYWYRRGNERALFIVEKTLEAIRLGGIFDQIGFGFHRYSTDQVWLVPHFEKMLYDQALLAMAYTEAYQATKKELYKTTAQQILEYVQRDMTSPEGGFYSAEDADSEGEEGKFYVWSEQELVDVLGKEDAGLFIKVFKVEKEGNYLEESNRSKNGTNILHLKSALKHIARELKMEEQALQDKLEALRGKLFQARELRVHPLKDDKVLVDWNGLMIAALAKAYMAFDEPAYKEAAENAAHFILNTMRDGQGRLMHRYRDGEVSFRGMLDDYAYMSWGLIELYEATFKERYLEVAIDLARQMIHHFLDQENGAFFKSADDAEEIIVRDKEIFDGAAPSGNSVAMLNLVRLARMTGDVTLEEQALNISKAFSETVTQVPQGHTQLMLALDFAFGPSSELVIVGDPGAEDTKSMVKALRSEFIPNKVVLFKPAQEKETGIEKLAEFTKQLSMRQGQATVYVCRNYKCEEPLTDPHEMIKLLKQQ